MIILLEQKELFYAELAWMFLIAPEEDMKDIFNLKTGNNKQQCSRHHHRFDGENRFTPLSHHQENGPKRFDNHKLFSDVSDGLFLFSF